MVQEFFLWFFFLDGQGNFGLVDGDLLVVMWYIEVCMVKLVYVFFEDIEKDIVDFQLNYDDEDIELVVLFVWFLNIFVNGFGGIVVGMVINIFFYNLGELIDVCIVFIDSLELQVVDLMEYVFGFDFFMGGLILGCLGIWFVVYMGCGFIMMCGKVYFEEVFKDKIVIIVIEIFYQVNKVVMIEKIVDLVWDKWVEGIIDFCDEFDCYGMCVVIELCCDVNLDVIVNQFYCYFLF